MAVRERRIIERRENKKDRRPRLTEFVCCTDVAEYKNKRSKSKQYMLNTYEGKVITLKLNVHRNFNRELKKN